MNTPNPTHVTLAVLLTALTVTAFVTTVPAPEAGTADAAWGDANDASASGAQDDCPAPCAGVGLQLPSGADVEYLDLGAAFNVIAPGFAGAEPTLGVSEDGQDVYIQFGVNTARSLDGGSTWAEIGPLYMNQASLDPMLYYDVANDQLFVQHLTVECTLLARTDNPSTASPALGGHTSWLFNPHACGAPGIDHPKLEGGPSPTLSSLNRGRSLYMAYSQAGGGATVAKSVDGGFTWVNVIATDALTRGTVLWPTGPVTADQNGPYVYLPHHTPARGLMVAHSDDEGLTYETDTVTTGFGTSGHAVDPEVAVDDSGAVYVVWYNNANHQVYYSYSTNRGNTWQPAVPVSDGTATPSTVFPAVVANETGKLDIVYYGTPDSSAGPDNCAASGSSKCVWYVYMAQVTDADTSSPTVSITQVTPNSDPVQIGKICTEGTDCASGTRNLLDFIDIKVDGAGYAHIAYTDGCVGSCSASSTGQTTAEAGRYAQQTTGSTI